MFKWKNVILLFLSILCGCSLFSGNNCYQGRYDLMNEYWQQCIPTCADDWLYAADRWFVTGNPNQVEVMNMRACPAYATVTRERSPFFDKIFVKGSFQVQIMGSQPFNSVTILGPNAQTRFVLVDYNNNALNLRQIEVQNVKYQPSLNQVIVRVGMKELHDITSVGCSHISGRFINTSHLCIDSCSAGNIMFVGNMNLQRIRHIGNGMITLFGVCSPCCNLYVNGRGSVNLSGKIGIQSIYHQGCGGVNILGANSNQLSINTSGSGINTISGPVNLQRIIASGYSKVYLNCIQSNNACIAAYQCAKVGLAGRAGELRVNLFGQAQFLGSHLRSQETYIMAQGNSHANVTASKDLFARGADNSSIYFFGPSNRVATQLSGNGLLIGVR